MTVKKNVRKPGSIAQKAPKGASGNKTVTQATETNNNSFKYAYSDQKAKEMKWDCKPCHYYQRSYAAFYRHLLYNHNQTVKHFYENDGPKPKGHWYCRLCPDKHIVYDHHIQDHHENEKDDDDDAREAFRKAFRKAQYYFETD
jgi:hypothetical protein